MPELGLQALQDWMALVIRHERDSTAAMQTRGARRTITPAAVMRGDVVRLSERMTPMQRLDVYNNGYFFRLLEVLQNDYPVLEHALGADTFRRLVMKYLTRHPSRHPNLNQLGKHMPDFVARQRDLPHRAFARDVARLERAMSEAFDAADRTRLDMTAMQSWGEAEWASAVLELHPSLRLLQLAHPANAYLQARLNEAEAEIPRPRASWVAVYRSERQVWRLEMPRVIHGVLAALQSGAPFGQALAAAGQHGADVGKWFREWSQAGLFVGVQGI